VGRWLCVFSRWPWSGEVFRCRCGRFLIISVGCWVRLVSSMLLLSIIMRCCFVEVCFIEVCSVEVYFVVCLFVGVVTCDVY